MIFRVDPFLSQVCSSVYNHYSLSSVGVGFSTNAVYREDGHRQEEHVFEDQSIHLKYNDSIDLYGVFDGHDGVQLAKTALEQITAEILLGGIKESATDEEVKKTIKWVLFRFYRKLTSYRLCPKFLKSNIELCTWKCKYMH